MKSRLARAAVVTVMVFALAITPLSVVLSAGHFETWLPSWDMFGRTWAHIALSDETGMVRAISPAGAGAWNRVVNPGGNRYVLEVTWTNSSCVAEAQLGLRRSDNGLVLEQRTLAWNCGHLDLTGYSVAIYLWSPIDAATVRFESLD